jgi:hypothetical protein
MLTPHWEFSAAMALETLWTATLGWRGWWLRRIFTLGATYEVGDSRTKSVVSPGAWRPSRTRIYGKTTVRLTTFQSLQNSVSLHCAASREFTGHKRSKILACAACSVQGACSFGISSDLYPVGIRRLSLTKPYTFASEIGKEAYGDLTFLITTLGRTKGTEGAVSAEGHGRICGRWPTRHSSDTQSD